jgi:hypothetical protein
MYAYEYVRIHKVKSHVTVSLVIIFKLFVAPFPLANFTYRMNLKERVLFVKRMFIKDKAEKYKWELGMRRHELIILHYQFRFNNNFVLLYIYIYIYICT